MGQALYGIRACINAVEQDALCRGGQSWKQSQANLLGALDISIGMKFHDDL